MRFHLTSALSIISLILPTIYILRLYIGLSELDVATIAPDLKHPNGVPEKFHVDGKVQIFPGNTIQCALSNSTDLYASLVVLRERLQQSPLAHLYALLPPSSWHMTVFEGATESTRMRPGYWPDDLAANVSIQECTALWLEKLKSFDLRTRLPYHLSIVGYTKNGLGLLIRPHKQDNQQLRGLRDRLSKLLHTHHPDHDRYGFHISLAYLLGYFTDQQRAELQELLVSHFLGMPERVCVWKAGAKHIENMYAFKPLWYLKNLDE